MSVSNSNSNVSKVRGKAKIKMSTKRDAVLQKLHDSYSEEMDTKIAVIQELIPLGLKAVAEELQNDVLALAGKKHARGSENSRWGTQDGSVYLRDQKLPIRRPRVRNAHGEVPLNTYEKLQKPFRGDDQTITKLLHGLSTHRYHESASLAAESFGISASNLSKRFKRNTAEYLRKLQTRTLSGYDFVAIFIDAKRFSKDGIMVGMGITLEGKKVILGIEQMHSEASRAIEQWLDKLIERGLKYEEGILFITDGSKGIKKGIKNKFNEYAIHQRCLWHKCENVLSYLNPARSVLYKRQMKQAYAKTTYKEAKAALNIIHSELEQINTSAANSLEEGLEETLTLHTLGLSTELKKSSVLPIQLNQSCHN